MNFLTADVAIVVDASKLPAQLAKSKDAATRTAKSMQNAFKKMGIISTRIFNKMIRLAKLAAVAILAAGAATVKFAMDAQESENLFEESMGNMASAARRWSEELSDVLYLNEYEVRKVIGTFNVMFDSMGLGEKAAYNMATGLTQLSYDMASFYNLKPAEAFQKLQAGITGEAEPLKRLGILINETTVKQYALNNAIWDGTGKLTELEKVQSRYGLILKQTKKAQGDLERTLRSSTNVFRSIWAIIKSTAIDIGNNLLPRITEIGLEIRDWLKENQDEVAEWAGVWGSKIEGIISWFIKWRKEVIVTVSALGGLVIFSKISGWAIGASVAIKGLVGAIIGVTTAYGLAGIALKSVTAQTGIAATVAQKTFIAGIITRVGKLRFLLTRLIPILKVIGVVGAAVFAAWQTGKVVIKFWEWGKAADEATEAVKRMERQLQKVEIQKERLAAGLPKALDVPLAGGFTFTQLQSMQHLPKELREEIERLNAAYIVATINKEKLAKLDTPISISPKGKEIELFLAEQKKEKQRELNLELLEERRIRLELSEISGKNYKQMMSALQFEYNMLGETNDVRERAIEMSNVQAEIDKMIGVDRIQMMNDYIDLYDKLIEKQNSFGLTIQLWIKKVENWGKRLGEILTNAFDSMADGIADAMMGMEMDWKAFGRMFIKELLKMIVQMQIAFVLKTALGFGGFGGAPVPTQATGINSTASPVGLAEGGLVTQSGWAKIDKGERFSGVNNEQGFGNTVVNISDYAGVDIEVDEYKDSNQRILDVTMTAASGDGTYRRLHKLGN